MEVEYTRNEERCQCRKYWQQSFADLRGVTPVMGTCRQPDLEYVSTGIPERNGDLFPTTLVGTHSHTPGA